ncbi:hypothetical protein ACHQM5_001252 [Ranunculus cassubicifolius]
MKLWATNEVRAKSKFWYFLRKLKKVKKSNGQVLAINESLAGQHPDVLETLTPNVRKRVEVLREIQAASGTKGGSSGSHVISKFKWCIPL